MPASRTVAEMACGTIKDSLPSLFFKGFWVRLDPWRKKKEKLSQKPKEQQQMMVKKSWIAKRRAKKNS